MDRVAQAGSTGARSGAAIVACTATSDRAVLADNGMDVNQSWIVSADGPATQVVSTVFYLAFAAGF
jgi:hypothetical protein